MRAFFLLQNLERLSDHYFYHCTYHRAIKHKIGLNHLHAYLSVLYSKIRCSRPLRVRREVNKTKTGSHIGSMLKKNRFVINNSILYLPNCALQKLDFNRARCDYFLIFQGFEDSGYTGYQTGRITDTLSVPLSSSIL